MPTIGGAMRRHRPITKLSDDFGQYDLRIKCRKCNHARLIEPHALAKIVGWESSLEKAATRFRCSTCGAKDVELTATTLTRPRGVPKSPH